MSTREASSELQEEGDAGQQVLVADWDPFSLDGSASIFHESFTEMLGGFCLPENSHILTASCPSYPHEPSNEDDNIRQRKRKPDYAGDQVKHAKTEWLDTSSDTAKSPMKKHEKEEKGVHVHVHVRAKRGQATSSHSLAERVRRERISERMKFLQDLVPGCNKITGKAVMLDEIINYVRSLQRQVEFLAMKLASINPELNVDMEQIFPKEHILLSRYQTPAIPWYNAGISPSNAELVQAGMAIPTPTNQGETLRTNPYQKPNMSQLSSLSDAEFQKVIHVGFSDPPLQKY